ncbi:MFS transporter [Actinoplanes sp. NEAU-H7]|uniref:MFS transporter n=1 Tax=Actinoplanes flavus TaxID=2820290 RepID=A0ABS3UN99_9ACTN|nr:MFS transporter [Actinoplanes flavus]
MGRLAGRYVPAGRDGRILTVVALIDSTGTGLYLAGATVFFLRAMLLEPDQIGLGLAVAGCAGFVTTLPMGLLADRIGAKRTLIGMQVWRAAWFAAFAFTSGPVAFTLIASAVAVAERAASPTTQMLVGGTATAEDRTRTMAVMRSVRNVGFGLGALLATPLLAHHSTWAYRGVVLADALSFVLAALLLTRVRDVRPPRTARKPAPLRSLWGFRDWRYLLLASVNGLLTLHMTLLSVALPLWALRATTAPPSALPLLVLVNTVLAVLLQVPMAGIAQRPDGALRALRYAGLALAVCCALFAAAAGTSRWTAVAVLLAAVLALTAGELWQATGAWDLSYAYAPPDRTGEYLSVFSLGATVQQIAGPALVTSLIVPHGRSGWLALAVLLAVTAAVTGPVVRMLARDQPTAPARHATRQA